MTKHLSQSRPGNHLSCFASELLQILTSRLNIAICYPPAFSKHYLYLQATLQRPLNNSAPELRALLVSQINDHED